MSRPLRLEAPGEFFHVLARGNAREPIFGDDDDREAFLGFLAESVDRYSASCHAYCLMGNHYHLILQPSRPNLSVTMRFLNGEYARRFNRRHRRTGHLFEGRFKSLLVQRDTYLTALARYIALNPVRAGLVHAPEDWPWSSYRATVGLAPKPRFLSTSVVLSVFGSPSDDAARRSLREFVDQAEPRGAEAADLTARIDRDAIAGDRAFIRRFDPSLVEARCDSEYPRRHRYAGRPALEQLFAGRPTAEHLAEAIRVARERYGYRLQEIAATLGLSVSTVGRILCRTRGVRARFKDTEGIDVL